MYWVSADSLADSLTALFLNDKEETSFDMARGLLISPFLKDSTMFSRDCISSVEMIFSLRDSLEEWIPLEVEFAFIEVMLEFPLSSLMSIGCVSLCDSLLDTNWMHREDLATGS